MTANQVLLHKAATSHEVAAFLLFGLAPKMDPQLVVHGKNGDVTAVHYEQINNMLINEFLKEHKKVEELQAIVVQQQKGMDVLTAQLEEQAAQIQKVSAQVEVNNPESQVVVNEP